MDEAQRSVAAHRGQRSGTSVIEDMAVIGNVLEALRTSVSDGDPSGGVGRMMHCAWFGELILAFPQAHKIRIPLAPPDDKAALAGRLCEITSSILNRSL